MTEKTRIMRINDPVRRLFEFARERHAIYMLRQIGSKPPWTSDPILRDYRFCCVYRELDRVTKWIHERWLFPNAKNQDVWFAMCVARLLNQPKALEVVGLPVPWRAVQTMSKLYAHRKTGGRTFNAAYIVSTNGISTDKILYVCRDVLTPLWQGRDRLRPRAGDTLNSWHMMLGQMQGFGSFMTAQVIADVKHVEPLKSATDWWTFAASGPGSRRGLNYVMERDRGEHWTEEEWRLELGRLREQLLPMFAEAKMPTPDAQNVQNLLCEFSKYYRAATEGKMPKQKYRWR
jgi:5-hmdU DNA kinase-like protein